MAVAEKVPGKPIIMRNGTTARTAWSLVQLTSNLIEAAADGCVVFGVSPPCKASVDVCIYRDGIYRIDAASGVDFALGDLVYPASVTTIDAGSDSDKPFGVVVGTNPASAGEVEVALFCGALDDLTVVRVPDRDVRTGMAAGTVEVIGTADVVSGLDGITAAVASISGAGAGGTEGGKILTTHLTGGTFRIEIEDHTSAGDTNFVDGAGTETAQWIAFGTTD